MSKSKQAKFIQEYVKWMTTTDQSVCKDRELVFELLREFSSEVRDIDTSFMHNNTMFKKPKYSHIFKSTLKPIFVQYKKYLTLIDGNCSFDTISRALLDDCRVIDVSYLRKLFAKTKSRPRKENWMDPDDVLSISKGDTRYYLDTDELFDFVYKTYGIVTLFINECYNMSSISPLLLNNEHIHMYNNNNSRFIMVYVQSLHRLHYQLIVRKDDKCIFTKNLLPVQINHTLDIMRNIESAA